MPFSIVCSAMTLPEGWRPFYRLFDLKFFSGWRKALKIPFMLVYGDGDMFQLDCIMRFYQRLGGGLRDAGWMRETMPQNRLAILPDLTHYELFASPALATTVLPFLNGESNAPLWTGKANR